MAKTFNPGDPCSAVPVNFGGPYQDPALGWALRLKRSMYVLLTPGTVNSGDLEWNVAAAALALDEESIAVQDETPNGHTSLQAQSRSIDSCSGAPDP